MAQNGKATTASHASMVAASSKCVMVAGIALLPFQLSPVEGRPEGGLFTVVGASANTVLRSPSNSMFRCTTAPPSTAIV